MADKTKIEWADATVNAINGCTRVSPGCGGPGPHGGCYAERLTPTECERLMGLEDHFTAIPYRGKLAADGPRYKALGNSQTRNMMRWIAHGIAMTEPAREAQAA